MDEGPLGAKLDKLIGLFRLAFREEIAEAREAILRDPVAGAILESVGDEPMGAGELKSQVTALTGQSARTVERRLADLVAQGALTQTGSGGRVTYRSSGLL